jgi:signal transduction histidine kinase
VWMHEGEIWVESTGVPGKGSTFSFTLPIYTASQGENDQT